MSSMMLCVLNLNFCSPSRRSVDCFRIRKAAGSTAGASDAALAGTASIGIPTPSASPATAVHLFHVLISRLLRSYSTFTTTYWLPDAW